MEGCTSKNDDSIAWEDPAKKKRKGMLVSSFSLKTHYHIPKLTRTMVVLFVLYDNRFYTRVFPGGGEGDGCSFRSLIVGRGLFERGIQLCTWRKRIGDGGGGGFNEA